MKNWLTANNSYVKVIVVKKKKKTVFLYSKKHKQGSQWNFYVILSILSNKLIVRHRKEGRQELTMVHATKRTVPATV